MQRAPHSGCSLMTSSLTWHHLVLLTNIEYYRTTGNNKAFVPCLINACRDIPLLHILFVNINQSRSFGVAKVRGRSSCFLGQTYS
jgi:hypothetical protein